MTSTPSLAAPTTAATAPAAPTTGVLRVPGATLHYEVRGRGPLLLLIPGGTGGAASFDAVADTLATEYTVASYDPRGMSRSVLDDPDAAQHVAEHADDAFRLLELLSPDRPARVFGSSSGAIAAVHLLTAHPERVERLVAHEPPLVAVLPDAAVHRAMLARVRETLDAEGLGPAMAVFAAGLRKDGDVPTPAPAAAPLPPQAAARVERTMKDLPYFLGRIVPAFMSHTPDRWRLTAVANRLVLACGEDSHGELPSRPAEFMADRLGVELRRFPGGHIGLSTHPTEFAQELRRALADPRPNS